MYVDEVVVLVHIWIGMTGIDVREKSLESTGHQGQELFELMTWWDYTTLVSQENGSAVADKNVWKLHALANPTIIMGLANDIVGRIAREKYSGSMWRARKTVLWLTPTMKFPCISCVRKSGFLKGFIRQERVIALENPYLLQLANMMAVHMKSSQYGRSKEDIKWKIGKKLFELKNFFVQFSYSYIFML